MSFQNTGCSSGNNFRLQPGHWALVVALTIVTGVLLWFHSYGWVVCAFVASMIVLGAVLFAKRSGRERLFTVYLALLLVFGVLVIGVVTGVKRHRAEAPARAIADAQYWEAFKVKREIYKDLQEAGMAANGWEIIAGPASRYSGIVLHFPDNQPIKAFAADVELGVPNFRNNATFRAMRGPDGKWRVGCLRPGGEWVAFDQPIRQDDPRLLVEHVRQQGACPVSMPRSSLG